ncbi:MAG: rod shape-determining protein MreC [Lachnospiraceae bacterium]
MSRRRRRRRTEKKRISIMPKHVLFLLGFLSIVIMFASYKFPSLMLPVRDSLDTVIVPMQKGINYVGRSISDRLKLFQEIESLQAENKELKEQLQQLQYQTEMLVMEKYELNSLRELFELDQKYTEYPKVAARIIARESNGWYNVFTIDKGYEDGILKDMNVIAGNGLVGIVTSVRKNSATVRSVIDDSSKVSGMFLKTSDTCIISGDLSLVMSDGLIKVSMIPLNADIKDGDEVVTSHISDKFQQGILIGFVRDITVDSSNMTKTAYLTPAVDFQHLEEVLIITELKESYELDDQD